LTNVNFCQNITKSFRVLDEDDANLYLRETVSQIAFLLENKDINMEEAFYVLTRQPIVNAILLAEIEQHLPVSLHFGLSAPAAF
jgi:hypothetical protein